MNIFLLIGIVIAIPVSFLCIVGTFILYIKTINSYDRDDYYYENRDLNLIRTAGLLVVSIFAIPFIITYCWIFVIPIIALLFIAYCAAKYTLRVCEKYEIKRKS